MSMGAELIDKVAANFLNIYIGMWVVCLCLIIFQLVRRSSQRQKQQRQLSQDGMLKAEQKGLPEEVQPPQLKCQSCDGYYIFKTGKNGPFAGCSNYQSNGCRSTLSIQEFVRQYLREFGVKIYSWDMQCWYCNQKTKFYTYDLIYDLRKSIWDFIPHELTIGSIPALDSFLAQKYPFSHIYEEYSNMCVYCHAENPYSLPKSVCEIFSMSRAEEFFWLDTIKIYDAAIIEAITGAIIKLYDD